MFMTRIHYSMTSNIQELLPGAVVKVVRVLAFPRTDQVLSFIAFIHVFIKLQTLTQPY